MPMSPLPGPDERRRNLYEDPLSVLVWWYDLAIFLMMFPSNTVLVFLRKNMGYRLMRPWVFWVAFAILWGCGVAGNELLSGNTASTLSDEASLAAAKTGSYVTCAFALAMGVLAFIHRRRAWDLVFRDPDPVHTMSRGDSHLARVLPIPEWIIQRYIEPVLLIVLSGVLFKLQWLALATWFVVSGFCLAAIEALVIEKSINAFLDIRDARIEAVVVQEIDSGAQGGSKQLAAGGKEEKVGGLVTGSPELARLRAAKLPPVPGQQPPGSGGNGLP